VPVKLIQFSFCTCCILLLMAMCKHLRWPFLITSGSRRAATGRQYYGLRSGLIYFDNLTSIDISCNMTFRLSVKAEHVCWLPFVSETGLGAQVECSTSGRRNRDTSLYIFVETMYNMSQRLKFRLRVSVSEPQKAGLEMRLLL
jgi:hypothetical protein